MNSEAEDIELIERYLDGKLNEIELRDFNYRLEDDREFARKFRIRKAFPTLLNDTSTYKQKIAEEAVTPLEIEQTFRRTPPSRKRIILVTAGVIILAAVTSLMLLFRSGGSDPKNAVEEPKSSTPAATEIPATVPASDTFDVQKPAPEIIQPVILENPANGKTFSRNEEILFTWKQQVDSLTHFFIHSDANGRLLLWKSIKPGIREYQLPARTFLPGQYYWYVGSQTVKSTFFIVE